MFFSLKVFTFRLYICFEKRYTRLHTAETEPGLQTLIFTMKENYTFKSKIRKVVRRMSAVAVCALFVAAWAEGGTTASAVRENG